MGNFFNHLFYRIYWWNRNIVKEKHLPIFSTLLGFSILRILNLTILIFIFLVYYVKNPLVYPKWLHIILMVVFLIIDYFNYIHNKYYIKIISQAENESKKEKKEKDIIIFIYLILTFGLLIFLIAEGRKLVS